MYLKVGKRIGTKAWRAGSVEVLRVSSLAFGQNTIRKDRIQELRALPEWESVPMGLVQKEVPRVTRGWREGRVKHFGFGDKTEHWHKTKIKVRDELP